MFIIKFVALNKEKLIIIDILVTVKICCRFG